MHSGFSALLPPDVVLKELCSVPDPHAWEALPEPERTTAAAMVAHRRAEFAAGRLLARRALATLGAAPVAIPRRADRAPEWPQGIVGAITHCDGLIAAALAHRTAWRAIGIDAEVVERFDEEILAHIATPREQARVAALTSENAQRDIAVRFCAKECVQKAWGVEIGGVLPFEAVETADVASGDEGVWRFSVQHAGLAAIAGPDITVRWRIDGPLALAAITAK